PSREGTDRAPVLGLRRTDEIMLDIGWIVCAACQGGYQSAAGKFALGESCGFKRHAKAIDGCRNRHEAAIESKPARARCGETVCPEPAIPANALLLAFDQRELEQVNRFADRARMRGGAHGTYDFLAKRQHNHALLAGRSVANVDVELVIAEMRV